MFAVLNLTGRWVRPSRQELQGWPEDRDRRRASGIAKLEAKRKIDVAAGKNVAAIDRKIAKRKEDIADNQRMMTGQPMIAADAGDETPGWIRPFIRNAADNPELVSMRVQDAASKYSWLLIPMSVPFMWLLFPFRRRFNTYDHTVFVTYSFRS